MTLRHLTPAPGVAAAVVLLSLALRLQAPAGQPVPDLSEVDVLHYRFELTLFEGEKHFEGRATVTARTLSNAPSSFQLDLIGPPAALRSSGMQVKGIDSQLGSVAFRHAQDVLEVDLPATTIRGDTVSVTIRYSGVPRDGLLIDRNLHGDATIFGDNWPNRARHWLPTVDHPADKATVEFLVSAPSNFRVIANGARVAEADLAGGRRLTHWHSDQPISTKVMVLAAGPFAVRQIISPRGIPTELWVYPQDSARAFALLAPAASITDFFDERIGPFPYAKLAHVQARTRFGGMENASLIFYNENSFRSNRGLEELLAHEIAHQWFGDSVTEHDWPHVWLSEGFATYLEAVYAETQSGPAQLARRMGDARRTVIAYHRTVRQRPVIDTLETDPLSLLTPNAYQKGAWILHMLRNEIGAPAFFETLSSYYGVFRDSVASTDDFRRSAEQTAGRDLRRFFDQWSRRPGFPRIQVQWGYEDEPAKVTFRVRQIQNEGLYAFPLEIDVRTESGGPPFRFSLQIRDSVQTFQFPLPSRPAGMTLDPRTVLLFEGTVMANPH